MLLACSPNTVPRGSVGVLMMWRLLQGKRVVVLESHTAPGGAAHGFQSASAARFEN